MGRKGLLSFVLFALLLAHTYASEKSKVSPQENEASSNGIAFDVSEASSNDQNASPDQTSASQGKKTDFWGFWGFPHFWFHPFPHPWPFVQPPMPSGGIPKFHWPFVHPPLPSGWPKLPQWPFVHPPMPSGGWPKIPHWPFVHPPLPSGWPKIPHWPFVHPPMSSGGWPKFPHWPFVHPPLPSGWPKIPHWPFVHPPLPSGFKFQFPWFPHPHGGASQSTVEDSKVADDDARCSSTNAIVESCMRKNSFSYSYGYSFEPECCKAITAVSDDCAQDAIYVIKQQCSNVAAPPPTA